LVSFRAQDQSTWLDGATERLTAAGWRIAKVDAQRILAVRNGLAIDVLVLEGPSTAFTVTVYRSAPGTVQPFTVAGFVLGAAAGWLVAVRALRRRRALDVWWRVASAAFGIAGMLTVALFSWGNALFAMQLADGMSATDCFVLVRVNAVWLSVFAVVPAGLLLSCLLTLLAPPAPRSTPDIARRA
jgi:hypothetical protein